MTPYSSIEIFQCRLTAAVTACADEYLSGRQAVHADAAIPDCGEPGLRRRSPGRRRGTPAAMHMKLATYNIHACIGADGRFDPDRTAGVMRQLHADVLALQEVEHHQVDGTDLLDYLATATGMQAVAGPTLLRETRDYGNALLTRLPLLTLNRVDLSLPPHEPRGALDGPISACGPASDAGRCAACWPCVKPRLRRIPCCSATSTNGCSGGGRCAGCAATSQPPRSRAPTLPGFRCSHWTGSGCTRAVP